jgi:hypothetical protein
MNGSGLEGRRGFGRVCFHFPRAHDHTAISYDRRLISEAT